MASLKGAITGAMVIAGRGAAALRGRRTVVLCYHCIDPSLGYSSATPTLFREHLRWLTGHCEIIDFSDVYRDPDGERQLPRVALTFDDGYADNHALVLPLLEEFGVHATFFITAGLVAGDRAVHDWFTHQRRGEAVHALNWTQVRELADAGHTIGAHTWSHPVLAGLLQSELNREIGDATAIIEDQLGLAVPLIAYPFGKPNRHVDARVKRMVAERGFALGAAIAFRATAAHDDRFAVPRFFVAHDQVSQLAAKVGGDYDPLGWWHEGAPRWLAKLTSPADFAWTKPCA